MDTAKPMGLGGDGSIHLVVFRRERQLYALPLGNVEHALRMVAITSVPEAPSWVAGVISVHGRVIPVLDLRQRFGRSPKEPHPDERLLIMQAQGQTVALIVDEVTEVLEVPAHQVEPSSKLLPGVQPLAAVLRRDADLILVLEATQLLPTEWDDLVISLPVQQGIDQVAELAQEMQDDEQPKTLWADALQGGACPEPSRRIRILRSDTEILEERARALARLPAEESESETLHLVTFSLGEEHYGVEITLVQEIQPLESHTWSPVPCTPDFIVGAINIRGHVYSMMDMGRFLGLPSRPLSETAHILLVWDEGRGGKEGMELSILTDDLPQVINVPLSKIRPPSAAVSTQAQKYIRGVMADLLIVLDLKRLLADPDIIVHEEV